MKDYQKQLIGIKIIKNFIDLQEIKSFQQDHGFIESTGFRIKNFAYSSDVLNMSESLLKNLNNLDLWVVDCLRFEPHSSHAHFDKVMSWVDKIKPKKTVLTHMNFEIDYDHINSLLPKNCQAAYDGLKLVI